VQDARKQAGLEVSDRIVLMVEGDELVTAALRQYKDYLMSEALATSWQHPPADGAFVVRQDQGDARWTIALARDRTADG
jgi:isoleucyl-tRNA synthetase